MGCEKTVLRFFSYLNDVIYVKYLEWKTIVSMTYLASVSSMMTRNGKCNRLGGRCTSSNIYLSQNVLRWPGFFIVSGCTTVISKKYGNYTSGTFV